MMPRLKKIRLSQALIRYLIAGVAAFLVEYGSFYGLYMAVGWPLILANSVSFGLGLLTSFLLNRLWTFNQESYRKKAAHQFGFYVTLALINLFLTNILVELMSDGGVSPRLGKLAAMITTSAWNYFLFKAIIFTQQRNTPGKPESDSYSRPRL